MHDLIIFLICFCSKIIFDQKNFFYVQINLNTRGPLYTCLVLITSRDICLPLSCICLEMCLMTLNDFVFKARMDNVNLFKVRNYLSNIFLSNHISVQVPNFAGAFHYLHICNYFTKYYLLCPGESPICLFLLKALE